MIINNSILQMQNNQAATLGNIKVKKDLYNCLKDVRKCFDLQMLNKVQI